MHLIIVIILFVFIQVQPNGNDCGVFAVAFALAICRGEAPEELFFDVQRMRGHLCFCLTSKKIKPFPSKKRKIKNRDKRKNEAVAVFCKCRLLESEKMVCCDTCNKWYHDTCVVVPAEVWTMNSSLLWTCDACTL